MDLSIDSMNCGLWNTNYIKYLSNSKYRFKVMLAWCQ